MVLCVKQFYRIASSKTWVVQLSIWMYAGWSVSMFFARYLPSPWVRRKGRGKVLRKALAKATRKCLSLRYVMSLVFIECIFYLFIKFICLLNAFSDFLYFQPSWPHLQVLLFQNDQAIIFINVYFLFVCCLVWSACLRILPASCGFNWNRERCIEKIHHRLHCEPNFIKYLCVYIQVTFC